MDDKPRIQNRENSHVKFERRASMEKRNSLLVDVKFNENGVTLNLDSPRTIEACRELGIDYMMFKKKYIPFFIKKTF